MTELIDEVDSKGNAIGKHPASDLKTKMFMHKVVLVLSKTAEGKIILARRAKGKFHMPDTWCCTVGGKVSHGETVEEAASREMQEEVGGSYKVRKLKSFVYDEPDYKAIFTIFVTEEPVSKDDFVIDPEEIQYMESFSKNELRRMIKETPDQFATTFVAALKESIDLL